MKPEDLKEDLKVWDDETPQFGEGLVIKYEYDMVDVYYPDIEETVNYSKREAIKHLNIVRDEH